MTSTEASEPAHPSMLIAVIQDQDAEPAARALARLDVTITHLPSVGGFLGRRSVTLLIGVPQVEEQAVLDALQKSCRKRVEYIPVSLESAPMPLTAPTPVTIGGATIFSVVVEHYEEF